MKCLGITDGLEQIRALERLHSSQRLCQRRFNIRSFECRSAASARFLVKLIRPDSGFLLLLTEYGIWPSSENPHLFNLLRQHSGISAGLIDLPGHMFVSSEIDLLVCYIQIILISGWVGILQSKSDASFIYISHDSWAVLGSTGSNDDVDAKLTGFDLNPELFTGSIQDLIQSDLKLHEARTSQG